MQVYYFKSIFILTDFQSNSYSTITQIPTKHKPKPSPPQPKVSAKKYYGIWGEDGMTDQEFVDEIKSMRSFHRDIVEL